MNIPICGLALGAILMFMRVKAGGQDTSVSKFKQVDWLGNMIFIPSMVALLLGMVMGGIQHPWSSWRIIVPIVLGTLGWIIFHIQQSLPRTTYPSVPARLFSNGTSAAAYMLTFLSSILVQSISYFLPVWFQAVLGSSVLRSGVNFLPFAIGTLSFAIIGGILLSTFGKYRPLHAASFALSAIGLGLFTILSPSKARWAIFQLIASAGSGITLSTLLPAIMAGLAEPDVAAAAAVYSFIRTFGYIWGVTMPSIIFNAVFNKNLHLISSRSLRNQLRDGAAYSFASELHSILGTRDRGLWTELIEVYTRSLEVIWWVGLGISVVGLVIVGFEKEIELRKDLETEYGIDEKKEGDVPAGELASKSDFGTAGNA